MKKFANLIFAVRAVSLFLFSCRQTAQHETATLPAAAVSDATFVQRKVPDWAKIASIYEVNVRQYSPEGTFKAFETHLHRLKEMGVDILWFMPIHPISKANKEGDFGELLCGS